jgi:hypothetical protein
MPSNIPPSALGIPTASDDPSSQPKPKYVVSGSGHAAHPDDIIASCKALKAHVAKMQTDAERDLKQFEEHIKERELAEKRRVAPGWLDSDSRLLEPERSGAPAEAAETQASDSIKPEQPNPDTDQGAALDRAFGGMNIK